MRDRPQTAWGRPVPWRRTARNRIRSEAAGPILAKGCGAAEGVGRPRARRCGGLGRPRTCGSAADGAEDAGAPLPRPPQGVRRGGPDGRGKGPAPGRQFCPGPSMLCEGDEGRESRGRRRESRDASAAGPSLPHRRRAVHADRPRLDFPRSPRAAAPLPLPRGA